MLFIMISNQLQASEALEKANGLATKGNMDDAKKVIKETLESIKKAPTSKEEFVTK